MVAKRNAYRILVGKPEGKKPLRRPNVGGWTILTLQAGGPSTGSPADIPLIGGGRVRTCVVLSFIKIIIILPSLDGFLNY
jgi:hypothetical protein